MDSYRYFVSYTGSNGSGQVFGNSDISLAQPVRSGKDIRYIEQLIKNSNDLTFVTLLNVRQFDPDNEASS
jgi:hypothetical protein